MDAMYLCTYLRVPNGTPKYRVLGRSARSSAAVSLILPETVTADCIMASLPGGPILWQLPCTVQLLLGLPTGNLKSF